MEDRIEGSGRRRSKGPAVLLATWFGAGYLPRFPGTWGSLAALPFAWAISFYGGWPALAAASVIVFAIGLWSAGVYIRGGNDQDPAQVVIDEVAGQWLTLIPAPLDPMFYLLGFLLFRLFDIFKPWPVSWAERSFPGAAGVMLDDVAAGIYAGVILAAAVFWMGG